MGLSNGHIWSVAPKRAVQARSKVHRPLPPGSEKALPGLIDEARPALVSLAKDDRRTCTRGPLRLVDPAICGAIGSRSFHWFYCFLHLDNSHSKRAKKAVAPRANLMAYAHSSPDSRISSIRSANPASNETG